MTTFGFIVLRHVKDIATNEYWLRCYDSIRMWYPDAKIVFIDDGSDYAYVTPSEKDEDLSFLCLRLRNVSFVHSAYRGRGEILPYYYYLHNSQWFDKAVFLHDSVFVNARIPFESLDDRILWDFRHKACATDDSLDLKIQHLMENCEHGEVLKRLFRQKRRWKGCFGGMAVFSHSFVARLDRQFGLEKLMRVVRCRQDRMALERVVGLFFEFDRRRSGKSRRSAVAVFGNINEYCVWGYSYEMYLLDQRIRAAETKKKKKKRRCGFIPLAFALPLIKVWTGR